MAPDSWNPSVFYKIIEFVSTSNSLCEKVDSFHELIKLLVQIVLLDLDHLSESADDGIELSESVLLVGARLLDHFVRVGR